MHTHTPFLLYKRTTTRTCYILLSSILKPLRGSESLDCYSSFSSAPLTSSLDSLRANQKGNHLKSRRKNVWALTCFGLLLPEIPTSTANDNELWAIIQNIWRAKSSLSMSESLGNTRHLPVVLWAVFILHATSYTSCPQLHSHGVALFGSTSTIPVAFCLINA